MTALGDFSSGDVLTAADMNAIGTYVSYTPTFIDLTVGNGVINFTYSKINKFVHVHGTLTFGSTTSITATPVMSLPVAKINIGLEAIGTGYLGDSGTATYMMYPLAISTTTVALFRADHTVGSTVVEGAATATSPFTWTTGDRINVNLSYEAA